MAELVDAQVSKTCGGNPSVSVRLRLVAPLLNWLTGSGAVVL